MKSENRGKISGYNRYSKLCRKFCERLLYLGKSATIENRTKKINGYLTEELQQLNQELIRRDIPTSSQVQAIHIF